MSGKIIAVANRKGGVGKTTTTVNVASELAQRGRRVLVVDLDPQGHAGLGLNVIAAHSTETVHQIFRDATIDLDDAVRTSEIAGIDVLPAARDFDVHQSVNDPRALARALSRLKGGYDDILIDTSPAIDVTTVAALVAAQHVLIPTQLQHLAHDGILRLSKVLFKVATLLNQHFADLAIVPIQVDFRINLQRTILARLLAEFGAKRVLRGIRTDVALAEAFGSSQPVRLYRPQSRAASDYTLLTDDIMSLWRS